MIRPSFISTIRPHRSASAGSWVMMSRVAPAACLRAKSRSMTAAPVAASRLPVGSSAKMIVGPGATPRAMRSEEHTSELQSLMRTSYAVFCLKKKKQHRYITYYYDNHNTQHHTHHQH